MSPNTRAATALLFLVFAMACAPTTLTGSYRPVPENVLEPLIETLIVYPVSDTRPLRGRSRVAPGFLTLLPLVPYGHQQISPDRFTGDFELDVLNAVIADLRAARLARQVLKDGDLLPGQKDPVNPFSLHLALSEGIFHRNVTLYGLSFAGAMLWFVGLPTSYGSFEMALDVELRDHTGRSLGEKSFLAKAKGATEWFYYSFTPAYTKKVPRAFEAISPEMRAFLRESLSK